MSKETVWFKCHRQHCAACPFRSVLIYASPIFCTHCQRILAQHSTWRTFHGTGNGIGDGDGNVTAIVHPQTHLPQPTSTAPGTLWHLSHASPALSRHSNDAGPPSNSLQEMDSSGAGALVAHQAPPLPHHSHTPDRAAFGVTDAVNNMSGINTNFMFPQPSTADEANEEHSPKSRNNANRITLATNFEADHVHSGVEEQQVSPTSTNAAFAASMLANFTNGQPIPAEAVEDDVFDENDPNEGLDLAYAANFEPGEQEAMKAYAKLVFNDGDYYITTLQVTLGRDMHLYRQVLLNDRQKKQKEKAKSDLEQYRSEASQASHVGDGDDNNGPSSRSNESLEGRPARALPSNYSEQGGAVSFAAASDDEANMRRRRRRRRRHMQLISGSSSNGSVAPVKLHPFHPSMTGSDFGMIEGATASIDDAPEQAFVPIHPPDPADIKRISKQHLLFTYNFPEETWELEVLGKFATVNGDLLRRGSKVALQHGDRISVHSLDIQFKLPIDEAGETDSLSHGVFSDEVVGENEAAEEPRKNQATRRFSDVLEGAVSESDEEEEKAEELAASKVARPKVKISIKKSKATEPDAEAVATKSKKGSKSTSKSPELARKEEKGKKPKVSEQPEGEEEAKEPKKTEAPPHPINIPPDSILGTLTTEELPQKRKGPGRPPKNGLISKRDESMVKRKFKEYDKAGIPRPPFQTVLEQVRAETKQREAAQKAAANGLPVPVEMGTVMQSIETDQGVATTAEETAAPAEEGDKVSASAAKSESKASPPPVRQSQRAFSPIKPESEYTEAELQKPPQTYVHLLHDLLTEIGSGELQDIYEALCKKYPWFRYRAGTVGWQSSVRHNLLQNNHFKRSGKSGKSGLWMINPEVPLEKEKKRRATPPPQRPVPPGWPQNQQGPYGPQGYGVPGQQGQQYGPGAYASPYGPSQGYGMPNGARPPYQQQQYPPQPQQPKSPFQQMILEIVAFRNQYLSAWREGTEEYNAHHATVQRCVDLASSKFHAADPSTVVIELQTEEERAIYTQLDAIMDKYPMCRGPIKKATSVPREQQEGTVAGANATAAPSAPTVADPANANGVLQQPQTATLHQGSHSPYPPATTGYAAPPVTSSYVPSATATSYAVPPVTTHASPAGTTSFASSAPTSYGTLPTTTPQHATAGPAMHHPAGQTYLYPYANTTASYAPATTATSVSPNFGTQAPSPSTLLQPTYIAVSQPPSSTNAGRIQQQPTVSSPIDMKPGLATAPTPVPDNPHTSAPTANLPAAAVASGVKRSAEDANADSNGDDAKRARVD